MTSNASPTGVWSSPGMSSRDNASSAKYFILVAIDDLEHHLWQHKTSLGEVANSILEVLNLPESVVISPNCEGGIFKFWAE